MRHFLRFFFTYLLVGAGCIVLVDRALGQHLHHEHAAPVTTEGADPEVFQYPRDRGIPFSYYGYRHPEMHHRGFVQRLIDLTQFDCCDGGRGGMCRITLVDVATRQVLIDGRWQSYNLRSDRIRHLEGFEPGVALVCASRTHFAPDGRAYTSIWCIGLGDGT